MQILFAFEKKVGGNLPIRPVDAAISNRLRSAMRDSFTFVTAFDVPSFKLNADVTILIRETIPPSKV